MKTNNAQLSAAHDEALEIQAKLKPTQEAHLNAVWDTQYRETLRFAKILDEAECEEQSEWGALE